jgi:hypothetical protein
MSDSTDTCLVYKCPKCTDHTLMVRPCWTCKIPMEQTSIPSKGRYLVEAIDMMNSRIMEMNKMMSSLANIIAETPDDDN